VWHDLLFSYGQAQLHHGKLSRNLRSFTPRPGKAGVLRRTALHRGDAVGDLHLLRSRALVARTDNPRRVCLEPPCAGKTVRPSVEQSTSYHATIRTAEGTASVGNQLLSNHPGIRAVCAVPLPRFYPRGERAYRKPYRCPPPGTGAYQRLGC